MVDKVTVKYHMKNQTTTPVHVTLYDIVPRRSVQLVTEQDPASDWNGGMQNSSITVVGNANATGYLTVGTTPFQSTQFTKKWKVRNVTSFVLDGGAEHMHMLNITIGGMFDWQRVGNDRLTKGITMLTMMVLHGGVVGSNAAGQENIVTTSDATIQIVSNTRVTARMLEKSTIGNVIFNDIPIVAEANQTTINEESDVQQTVTAL